MLNTANKTQLEMLKAAKDSKLIIGCVGNISELAHFKGMIFIIVLN